MLKYLLACVICFTSSVVMAWDQNPPLPISACASHVPYGTPSSIRTITPICRTGYLVGYDQQYKVPAYVAYTLTTVGATGCIPRTNSFATDASIKNSATPRDYIGSGFDRGHASPANDQSWNTQTERESFLMTNVYPQHKSLNRGIWKTLEDTIRYWTVTNGGSYTIYVGAIYDDVDQQIGSGVVVPHGYYKIAINNTTHEVVAWLFPHTPPYNDVVGDVRKYRMTVQNIQALSHTKYQMPDDYKELGVGMEWAGESSQISKFAKSKCGT